jgi:TetR/AcrR family transcriptional repressor of mexJK operon
MDCLVACAGDLFLKHGYHKVSLSLIAREARVAVRTIYLKFGGKAGLFHAVVRSQREALLGDIVPMAPGTSDLREVLFDFALRYLRLVTSERSVAIQRLVIAEAPNAPEVSRSFMQAGPEPTLAMLSQFFSQADVRSQLRSDFSAEEMARYLMTCLLGDHSYLLCYSGSPRTGEVSHTATRAALGLFLDGCRKRPE